MGKDIVRHSRKLERGVTNLVTESEDRVIANLSKDDNKVAVFTEGIDGHSLGSTYYFKAEVEQLLGHAITDHKQAAKELKQLVDDGDKEAKAIRQRGKPVTLTTKRLHTVMYVE